MDRTRSLNNNSYLCDMICIYHSKDLDGQSSAAIIRSKFPGVELIGYDYGDSIPAPKPDVPLIVVDVSFPMDTMLKMSMERNMNLTWIDHHIKSIKEYERFMQERKDTFCVTKVVDGIAACELTWQFLHPNEDMPLAITLLGKYDVGRKEDDWDSVVLPFQFGMRSICSSPHDFPVELLNNTGTAHDLVISLIEKGHGILAYLKKTEAFSMQRVAFEADFLGHKALCFNSASYNFLSFASQWDNTKYDIAVGFCFNGKQWNGSIYSDKAGIDCNEIARRLGGGGHVKAAGFSIEDIKSALKAA